MKVCTRGGVCTTTNLSNWKQSYDFVCCCIYRYFLLPHLPASKSLKSSFFTVFSFPHMDFKVQDYHAYAYFKATSCHTEFTILLPEEKHRVRTLLGLFCLHQVNPTWIPWGGGGGSLSVPSFTDLHPKEIHKFLDPCLCCDRECSELRIVSEPWPPGLLGTSLLCALPLSRFANCWHPLSAQTVPSKLPNQSLQCQATQKKHQELPRQLH